MGRDTVHSGINLRRFLRSLLPPTSRQKNTIRRMRQILPERRLFHSNTILSSVNSFHAVTPNFITIILICSSHIYFFRIATSFQIGKPKGLTQFNSIHATFIFHLAIPYLNSLLTSDKEFKLSYKTPSWYFLLIPVIFLYVLSTLFSSILYLHFP
jgi:hypothetical protein